MNRTIPTLSGLALLALGACNEATTAPAPPPSAAPAAGGIQELVQIERKEPADHDWRLTQAIYDICKAGAQAARLPVKPFPPMPAGFGEERITTILDGKSTTVIKESAARFAEGDTGPDRGCEYRIDTQKQQAISITHGGTVTTIERLGDGPGKVLETNEYPDMAAYIKVRGTEDYTDARTVNGVQMRCLPKDFWLMNTNKYLDMRAMCVYHKDGVLLDEAHEKPIVLLSHVLADVMNKQFAYTAITEPLSLRVRASSEPDPFSPATWTK
jgi:hypothetical protein